MKIWYLKFVNVSAENAKIPSQAKLIFHFETSIIILFSRLLLIHIGFYLLSFGIMNFFLYNEFLLRENLLQNWCLEEKDT